MNTEQKLAILRKRWKKEPHNRKIIEMQAKLLKMGKKETFEDQVMSLIVE